MNSSIRARPIPRQSGLTLLEILIAVLVLSVGLLGVAGLQLAGLKNGQQSYQRSQVTALAYEMADRMRANSEAAIAGTYAISAVPTLPAANCATSACTGAELALWDRYDWYVNHLATTLPPGASASIGCLSGCGRGLLQIITINWDENRDGNGDSSYSIRFVP